MNEVGSVTRRGFIGGAAASAVLAAAPNVFAQGSDKIRVGVIGCGGRGSAHQCFPGDGSSPGVRAGHGGLQDRGRALPPVDPRRL